MSLYSRHRPDDVMAPSTTCREDGQLWPCDTAGLTPADSLRDDLSVAIAEAIGPDVTDEQCKQIGLAVGNVLRLWSFPTEGTVVVARPN